MWKVEEIIACFSFYFHCVIVLNTLFQELSRENMQKVLSSSYPLVSMQSL